MMSMAIIGALAALLVLVNNPGAGMAHGGDDHQALCDAMTDAQIEAHNAVALVEGTELCSMGGTDTGNGDGSTDAEVGELDVAIEYQADGIMVSWAAVEDASEYVVEYRVCTEDACTGAFACAHRY